MTWGEASSEAEAHWQLDEATDHGINFLDTAEMYPTNPVRRKTAGRTEKIIGTWLKKRKGRHKIILATKIIGKGSKTVRDGGDITKETIDKALIDSLRRLDSEYVDLYQLHWPNRGSYHFRQNWNYNPCHQVKERTVENIYEVMVHLTKLVNEGKIRTLGLSNETAWGTMQYLNIAKEHGLEQVVSIQNEYSLLCRYFDTDLAEISHNEKISLLAYSPLAAGLLTGKYQKNKIPIGSRLEVTPDLMGRHNSRSLSAVEEYLKIAKNYSINPINLALAFCEQRAFMGSVIFGATKKYQLKKILEGLDLTLSKDICLEIDKVHRAFPFPI